MKKIILFIICLVLLHLASAQETLTYGKLRKIDGVYYIESKGVHYLVDTSVVTVKLRDGIEKSCIALNIIRTNKLGFIHVAVPHNTDLEEFVSMLKMSNDFASIDYNSFGRLCFSPNDFHVSNGNQWYLSYIKAFEAWDLTTGSSSVKAVVIDTGLDWGHPDIGLGNDGYKNVDETLGWNCHFGNSNWLIGEHGTWVSGILGAKSNNGIGIAGISGGDGTSPGITMIPITISTPDQDIYSGYVAEAITRAVDYGARVINMSFELAGPNSSIDSAIDYAVQRNVVLVAASGNIPPVKVQGPVIPQVQYPASHPDVIAVGAVKKDTTRWEDSQYTEIDGVPYNLELNVVAPGVDMWTTNLGDYESRPNGTSYAAPVVSGIVALMLSVNPNLTTQQVRDIIESTAQKVKASKYGYNLTEANGAYDDEMGYGLVNAHAAVLAAMPCKSDSPLVYGVITHNTAWNTPIHAVGNIIIPNNVTLTISSSVMCNPHVSINIHSGGKLIINGGGTLTNACEGEMWQGIIVLGGSVEIKNNSKIENAVCGITVTGGGVVEATGAHFVNNTTHVKFEPSASGQSGLSGTFTQTNFTMNNGYLGNPINFDAQLKMESSNKTLVTGHFVSPISFNIDNGIIAINTATTWAGNIQLLSVPVAIQAGGTLTNTDIISSNEHTTITVHPGAKIVVDGGIFKNTTGQFWQGITVLGNTDPNAPFTQNYQGFIQLKNNAKIENAVCGITVTGGGMVAATDARFINNTIGVKFETVASRQSTISGRFTQTNFVLNDSYMGNMADFETHLKMESSGEVRVIGCNFSSTVPQNSSTPNKNYGIMASNTSLTVKEYCNSPIINPDGSCPGNIPSVFSGFSRAISANSSGRSPVLRVSYSIFNNNLRSINISGINNHELIRNHFNLTASNSYGVHISNATGYKIEENHFKNTAPPATNTGTVGLRIGNSGSAENEVYKLV
jgi:subtilisin family serine protease